MIFWSAAILAVLGLTWSIGAVVVPVWQVRVLMAELRGGSGPDEETAIRRLGGPAAAAWKLAFYRRLPLRIAPDKYSPRIFEVLGKCGPAAIPPLIEAVREEHGPVRLSAIKALIRQDPPAPEAAPALAEALAEEWEPIHCYAIEGLTKIGPAAACAVPALEKEMRLDLDAPPWACPEMAVLALWCIAPERAVAALSDSGGNYRYIAADILIGRARSEPRAKRMLLECLSRGEPLARRLLQGLMEEMLDERSREYDQEKAAFARQVLEEAGAAEVLRKHRIEPEKRAQ